MIGDDGGEPAAATPAWATSIERRDHARRLKQTRPDPAAPRVLDVDHVTIELRGKTIVDDVSFFIPRGAFVCLCGPNGAGKSTLLKAVLGLLEPARGTIRIHGEPPARARHKVGYVPQRKGYNRDFPARPVELITAALRGRWPGHVTPEERERARAVLTRVGGARLLDQPLAGLSGGETQRVFLARALVTDPTLVILDEPTAGVDVAGRAELLELMAEISRSDELAAILVTHNLAAVAQTAERIVYLEGGRLIGWGLPDELLGQKSLTALAFAAADHARAPDEE
ncbi:MAG: ABC transporter ATP-binding protein [Kofleriaceae bacterium]|nr:ABC transporter ATP-binding protein [Kofleriaceae bacterium]MCL4223462.1 ABC transporter ATP-binding protein [Myxococcales bacterium]